MILCIYGAGIRTSKIWREQKDVVAHWQLSPEEWSPTTDSVFAVESVLAGQELLPRLQIAAPAPDQAESLPRNTSPHLRRSYLHMPACTEPSVERLVRVNIPLCLCRWNVCMCVRSSVCSLVCLSEVVVEPTAAQPAPPPLTARSHWHATWNI